MDDNRLYKKIVEVYLLGSIPVASVLSPALPFDMGLTFSLVSFGPVAAGALFLAARTVARRLRYAPTEGKLVGMDRKGRFSLSRYIGVYRWRYEFGGRAYEALDKTPNARMYYDSEVSPGERKTVYVDPADPSRLLPPSWKDRLEMYLTMAVFLLLAILISVNPQLFRSLPW